MTLAAGSRLGPYEIVAPLGAGGMGEVWRARDPRLGREVAIKVLPAHLIGHAEARARFEREARSVSSLNHPHICVLHDVGRQGDTDYLVMELVEGETLAGRITRGPLPIADVLRIGAQIADALNKAHRSGITHRDLKPANVMLTKSGAKLMDFGLARTTGSSVDPALTQAVTTADPVTAQGAILGTFQYMAPEQLEAREADPRTDIWALGCVLYEMATGARPFHGGTSASLISAILRDTPRPMAELAPLSPPAFERVVKQCLAKDPDDRWQSAGDLKRELEWIAGGSGAAPAIFAAPRRKSGRLGLVALAIGVLALVTTVWLMGRRSSPPLEIDSAITAPTGVQMASPIVMPLALSLDGRWMAFVGRRADGPDHLWVRALSEPDARELPGTERATMPFFSPDGRSVGFFSHGKLRRVDIKGGPVTVLADAPDPRGGNWGSDGTILFSRASNGPIYRVAADGGTPIAVTVVDTARQESTHRYPCVLPDGRHFLYLARQSGAGAGREPRIYVGDVKTGRAAPVLQVASIVAFASGHLLYVRQGALVAQRYDVKRNALHGPIRTILPDITMDERFSRASFAVSRNGVLLALTGKADTRHQLRWRGRNGEPLETVGEPNEYVFGGIPCISPDGRSAAMPIVNRERGNTDVWIVDLARGQSRRLTADNDDHYNCIWSRDGHSIIMTAESPPAPRSLVVRPVHGPGGVRTIMQAPANISGLSPMSESPNGDVLYNLLTTGGRLEIVRGSERLPLLPASVQGNQYGAQFSADGRFVVYDSDESGRFEIYVTPYPWTGERWQVSREGGWIPRWGRNGNELFFVDSQDRLTSVEVARTANGLEFGAIRPLFTLAYSHNFPALSYDEAPDGRFLVSERPTGSGGPQARLLTNWTGKLDTK